MKRSNRDATNPSGDSSGTPELPSRYLFDVHPSVCEERLLPATCTHAQVVRVLQELVARSDGTIFQHEAGVSIEGRSLYRLTLGRGNLPVLLWSQMHGDEPTATQVLIDILRFLELSRTTVPWVQRILHRLTLHVIPLLNPDGAEIPRRTNAVLVDLNRDALALRSPEGQMLHEACTAVQPAYAFNLHDQGLSSVGSTNRVAALALLAPPADEERSVTPARLRAMKMGSVVVEAVRKYADGHISRYDDAFEPRAFGDTVQALGTSTLLIESGHWPGDPEKRFVRRLNFVGILSVLHVLAGGGVDHVAEESYENLLPNGKRAHEIIIRHVTVRHRSGWTGVADLGISRNGMMAGPLVLKEVGDLAMFGALEERDGTGLVVDGDRLAMDAGVDWLLNTQEMSRIS